MSLMKTLFTENPMMIEITRFRRKFMGGGNALNSVILAMCGLIYIGIVALVWNYREAANPIILVFLQTGIFTLLAPALLHGAIAGERERRSWDFLLVAPVTQAQIVCGKFAGAAAAMIACAVALLFPVLIGAAFYQQYPMSGPTTSGVNFWNLFQAELLSVAWGLMVCAMTIFFSARCKRGFIALGTTLALLVASLIVWPILIASAGMTSAVGLLNFFNPFWTLMNIEMTSSRYNSEELMSGMYGFPQVVVYFGMTAVFLAWTERTLRFADSEVKFLPKTRKSASPPKQKNA